jgi:hypothetical protein
MYGKASYSVFGLDEGIVDGNHVDLTVLDAGRKKSASDGMRGAITGARNVRIAEDNTADTTETVDSNLDTRQRELESGTEANPRTLVTMLTVCW